jgi:hypothetical protein
MEIIPDKMLAETAHILDEDNDNDLRNTFRQQFANENNEENESTVKNHMD